MRQPQSTDDSNPIHHRRKEDAALSQLRPVGISTLSQAHGLVFLGHAGENSRVCSLVFNQWPFSRSTRFQNKIKRCKQVTGFFSGKGWQYELTPQASRPRKSKDTHRPHPQVAKLGSRLLGRASVTALCTVGITHPDTS